MYATIFADRQAWKLDFLNISSRKYEICERQAT